MLIDDLHGMLKGAEPDIAIIKKYLETSSLEERYNSLHALSQEEHFWQNPDRTALLKELQKIQTIRSNAHDIVSHYTELLELVTLFAQSADELNTLKGQLEQLLVNIKQLKIQLLMNQEHDAHNCYLTINAGAGGTESQDWAEMLLRMYVRFCEQEHVQTTIIDIQPAEEAGIKSATLFIKGSNAYGLLRSEHGIHRLVRISPFDANKRRHTSFAAVDVTPELPDITVTIDPKDLRIDTYRSSGAGGQHVNKTESAIRITHIPTGIVTQCQNERSQTQNKEIAMKMLIAKLTQKKYAEQQSVLEAKEKKKIEWGSQIRSYVLHPYKLVKDHRTAHESAQPDLVLDGDLIPFIESYLLWSATPT